LKPPKRRSTPGNPNERPIGKSQPRTAQIGIATGPAHMAKAHMAEDSRAAAMMALGAVERKIWNI
jgi:hypothetical protein